MASTRKSNLLESVAARLAPLVPLHSRILIGLSGGADSVVLLHLLHQLAPRFQWQLTALHVHHGMSPHADVWANFCANLCIRYAIPLHIERVNITPLREIHGVESAARQLRQAAFAKQACDVIALAHHADDQGETLMLQLLRGAGVKGLAAMPVLSVSKVLQAQAVRTLRPLLEVPRARLLEYATQQELQWVEDESNADAY
ncbi:MAG: tRNA lysidine(34) synthetase TilS, partial [Sideroxydans sp.]